MPEILIQSFYRGIAFNIKSNSEDMSDAVSVDPYRNYPYLEPGYALTDITHSVVVDKIMWMATHVESGSLFTYALGHLGNIYRIPQTNDIPVNLASGFGSMSGNGGMAIYQGTNEYLYYANDTILGRCTLSVAPVFTNSFSASLTSGPHPMEIFLGKLYIANGNNLIEIDNTDTITTLAKLNSGLPANYIIRAMKVDQSGQKLVMIASLADSGSFDSDCRAFMWEGLTAQYNYEYPINDNRVTALLGSNGPLFEWGNGFYGTTMRVFDGYQFSLVRLIRGGYNPPNPGAVEMLGDLAIWGSDGPSAAVYSYGSWQANLPPVFNQPMGFTAGSITNITSLKVIQAYVLNSDGTLNTPGRLYVAGYKGTTYGLYKAETQLGIDANNYDAGAIFYSQYYEFRKQAKLKKIIFFFRNSLDTQNFTPSIQNENGTDTTLTTVNSTNYTGNPNYAEVSTKSDGSPLGTLQGIFRLKIQNNAVAHWNISKISILYEDEGRP